MRLATTLTCVLLAPVADAAPTRVAGRVEAKHARVAGDVIVTESQIRQRDGSTVSVIQLGGVVDGVGMSVSHHPAPLVLGDTVELAVNDRMQVIAARSAVAPGNAPYGVVYTHGSKRPVWRASACTRVHFGPSIDEPAAEVIEAALDAWTTAGAGCGALALARGPARPGPVADGLDSIHLVTGRWCRPATDTEPEICYAPEATGVTRLRFVDDPFADDDGRIIEADILLNAVGYRLEVVTGPSTAIDLPSLVTHELGHLLGLSHSCANGTEAWPLDHTGAAVPACQGLAPDSAAAISTMYVTLAPGEIHQRTLEAEDRLAVCSLAAGTACTTDVVGGTGCASSHPSLSIGLLAIALRRRRAQRVPVASACSAPTS